MNHPTHSLHPSIRFFSSNGIGYIQGIGLTLVIAVLARNLAQFPILSVFGVMILSILIGMSWRAVMGFPHAAERGIEFSSKRLLKLGIILMGVRLNLSQIAEAGWTIVWLDVAVIGFTLVFVMILGKRLSVQPQLAALTAVGTAVCGAAAIAAVAPLVHAKKDHTAVAVATIAILGTVGTIIYTLVFPLIDMNAYHYGLLAGATLHELAHVIAAAVPGGDVSSEMAVLTKLGRVALLIPVALCLGTFFNRDTETTTSFKKLPIPWFIFGFLGLSLIHSLGWLPAAWIEPIILMSVFLLSMGMAGLGLSVNFSDLRRLGGKALMIGGVGSVALAVFGLILIYILL